MFNRRRSFTKIIYSQRAYLQRAHFYTMDSKTFFHFEGVNPGEGFAFPLAVCNTEYVYMKLTEKQRFAVDEEVYMEVESSKWEGVQIVARQYCWFSWTWKYDCLHVRIILTILVYYHGNCSFPRQNTRN
jgi:hypothetical protein